MRFILLLLILFIVISGLFLQFGSFDILVAKIQGKSILAEPEIVSLGNLLSNQRASSRFKLTNITSAPISIANVRTSCDCMKISPEFPVLINPGESLELLVEFLVSAENVAF